MYSICPSTYGVSSKLVEEASYEYVAIPLDPLPGRPLPPDQASGPTSASQMNEYENTNVYENTDEDPALQNRRAVVSGQARSTAPSHSAPQELGGDEHLYESTDDPASAATPTTATPTTIPVT